MTVIDNRLVAWQNKHTHKHIMLKVTDVSTQKGNEDSETFTLYVHNIDYICYKSVFNPKENKIWAKWRGTVLCVMTRDERACNEGWKISLEKFYIHFIFCFQSS